MLELMQRLVKKRKKRVLHVCESKENYEIFFSCETYTRKEKFGTFFRKRFLNVTTTESFWVSRVSKDLR